MLNKYEKKYQNTYKKLKKILSGNLSHAYLFSTNGNLDTEGIIIEFIKEIICENKENHDDNCDICRKIENYEYLEFKKLSPENNVIKKEQLKELQRAFSMKPLEGTKRIYWIENIETLNKQAANTILKFLEEPAEGIVAILSTSNINFVIETIISRCQVIMLEKTYIDNFSNEKDFDIKRVFYLSNQNTSSLYDEERLNQQLDNVIKFIDKYEDNKIKMINYNKEYFHDKFKEKDEIRSFFEIMMLIYRDSLKYLLSGQVDIFFNNLSIIKKITKYNNKETIIYKLNKIISMKEIININVNMVLFIDKVIIELEGGVLNV